MKFALCGLDCTKCGSFRNKECRGCQAMNGIQYMVVANGIIVAKIMN